MIKNSFPVFASIAIALAIAPVGRADVSVDRLRADLAFLAADEQQGRGVQTEGLVRSARYIVEQMKAMGLKPAGIDDSYYQSFEIAIDAKVRPEHTRLTLKGPNGQAISLEVDKTFQPLAFGGNGKFQAPVVFVGYGITADEYKYDDYKSVDTAGKVVLMMRREPQQGNDKSSFDGTRTTQYSSLDSKIKNAFAHHAAAVLFVSEPFTVKTAADDKLVSASYIGYERPVGLAVAQIQQSVADRLLAGSVAESLTEAERRIDENLAPISAPIEGWTAEGEFQFDRITAHVSNVIARIDGQGPKADETIVIGAHYDHLGFGGPGSLAPTSREIHNGADDNASGTSALLELARQFAARKKPPARRLVFIAFTAEERGLLGSHHYVNHPLFPLEKTVAMYNFDMVGRMVNDQVTMVGSGTAREFGAWIDQSAATREIQPNKSSGASPGFGASDHMPFYAKQIPVLHFFTGVHPDYHRPTDDPDKVNLTGMGKIVSLCEALVDTTLAQEKGPEYVKLAAAPRSGSGGGNAAYLGTVPDFTEAGEGVRLAEIQPGSPAEKAGLKAGDVILDIGGTPVRNARTLTVALRKQKPGDMVKVLINRSDNKMSLDVTLGTRPGQ